VIASAGRETLTIKREKPRVAPRSRMPVFLAAYPAMISVNRMATWVKDEKNDTEKLYQRGGGVKRADLKKAGINPENLYALRYPYPLKDEKVFA
jgi:hypothetical protein